MILTTKSGVEPHWTWTHEILPCLLFTCRLQDLLRTPYLPELPPQRGKLRPKCDGSLGVESDQQSQNCQLKSSQQSMQSILTCRNDRQAGTREDVRVVALAWLVSLQRNWLSPNILTKDIFPIDKKQEMKSFSPCQSLGSLGRASLRQTAPDHRCGCTPGNYFFSRIVDFGNIIFSTLKEMPPLLLYIQPCWSGWTGQRWSAPRWSCKKNCAILTFTVVDTIQTSII